YTSGVLRRSKSSFTTTKRSSVHCSEPALMSPDMRNETQVGLLGEFADHPRGFGELGRAVRNVPDDAEGVGGFRGLSRIGHGRRFPQGGTAAVVGNVRLAYCLQFFLRVDRANGFGIAAL